MSTLTEILESLSGGSGVARRLDAGEMLFTTGDPVRSLFVIERGQLRLLRHTAHGATLTLHVAQTGEAFAEASLFSRTYHCDAAADVSSLVRAYPKRRAAQSAARGSWSRPCPYRPPRAAGTSAPRPYRIAEHQIRSRRVLGYLHNHLSASAKHVELERTWKAIATEIGLTHEAVYRALAELERDGLIERDGKAVVLRQP